jgi:hypothetical protein
MTKIMFPYQYHHSYRRFQHLALYLKPKKEWMVSKKMGPGEALFMARLL